MAIRLGRVTRVASGVAALLLIALPAGAAHTPPHAIEEIWAVVGVAEQAMSDVVNSFEVAITGMDDLDQVEAAEAAADDEIIAIWVAARDEIDLLARPYKAVNKEAGAAKQQLLQIRNASRQELADLAEAWVQPVPPTTTTTLAPTTTTTTPATTTTTHANSGTTPPGGNGNGGGNGNTGSNGGENAGSQGQGGQSNTIVTPPNSPDVDNSPDQGIETPPSDVQSAVDAGGLGIVPEVSAIAVANDLPQAPGNFGSEEAVLTSQMSTVLETVLPPGMVDVVLSPLLVAEILTKTIMTDGEKVLIPVALLALCAAVIAFGDRLEAGSSRLLDLIQK